MHPNLAAFAIGLSLVLGSAVPAGAPHPPRRAAPPRPVASVQQAEPLQRDHATRLRGAQDWTWPVDAPVADLFRPPSSPWGPGNRGWEFAVERGQVVRAVGAGTVLWSGWVAGRGVVTIDHGGGLLSSMTGLSTLAVGAGQIVATSEVIGLAAPGLHLGFRLDGAYVDPAWFLGGSLHAVLVPLPG